MLSADQEKQNSFQRRICEGDLVIVYERHDAMKPVTVRAGSELQNRFGVFKHSDWIGMPFGCKVLSNKGSHRTQILYIADISFVVSFLEVVPGCVVLESGTGSGSLTTSLARAVAPFGHVYTFDFHEQRAASAREDFERNGLTRFITVSVRDTQGEGFPEEFCGKADSVFLDLPQPWLAVPSSGKMLKPDGVLCSFSPCIEQVQRSCEALTTNFTDVRTFEVLLRTYEVRDVKFGSLGGDGSGGAVRKPPCKRKNRPSSDEENNGSMERSTSTVMAKPCPETRGHTGFLTFARLRCS
ncbi:unnamed protein product [Spirodela intermedia]|uniref:tRNA (adenine(58)-N(1))-methyltransferase n=1 Tax=Spirodela intermedia TaxID=51605 RepID=A0A7I8J7Z6_SPIIN|nr:unnamed protein product [Spirodela intermedia]CAA6665542.1 unnamed protein product [Spirodela intermedia]